MKHFLTIAIFFYFASQCMAQNTPKEQVDPVIECIVHFIDDVGKAEKTDDDKLIEGVEVGRFLPIFGGEGTLSNKRFRLGKSNLFVLVSVFYEDDLWYDGKAHDAMTLGVEVTRSASENPKSWITASAMQIEYRKDFGAANIYVLINRKVKYSAVRMTCERKK